MSRIQTNGDAEIIKKYTARYAKNIGIRVTLEEIQAAKGRVSRSALLALKQMKKNIELVHKAQIKQKIESPITPEIGIHVWREWRAIEKVGIYVPGGKAVYPSSVLMSTIPAQIAGCKQISICTPPQDDGLVPDMTLVAADMLGIQDIFKVGGVEAIAAMAYGTQTIPRSYKLFGAGNSFVTAAKMLALDVVSIDMPAGPSEVLIIADETANPRFIAADLLADAEHGEDSACVLVSTSERLIAETIQEVRDQAARLVTGTRAMQSIEKYGLFALVDSLQEAIDFSNEYAPEHLQIMTSQNSAVVPLIINAGSVFLGDWTSKSAGDYATGANHVLPTGAMAKMYPPLGVDAYGKWMQVQQCTKEGLESIRETIVTIANEEQLPAHAYATAVRFY